MASYASHLSSSLSPERGVVKSEAEDRTSSSGLDPNILQALAEKRTTREGNPSKKRGPKPNAKPALTRRQELNRQAQRTHRERKETYIKALEDEVLRLKEVYSNVSLDKEKLSEENKQLRDALIQHGIPVSSPASSSSHAPGSSSTPMTTQATTPALSSSSHISSSERQQLSGQQLRDMTQQVSGRGGMDVDQAGIDFVLTLEKPCNAHLSFMVERRVDADGDVCGHALMASCPPEPLPSSRADIPFGHAHTEAEASWGYGTWQPSKADLATLLDLSKRLDLDGEITPIMAWGMVLAHPRVHELGLRQFRTLAEELVQKVRCYGFGAVLEEFEVRDALDSMFA